MNKSLIKYLSVIFITIALVVGIDRISFANDFVTLNKDLEGKPNTYDVFLGQEIGPAAAYQEIAQVVTSMRPDIALEVYLYGYGGDVFGGQVLMNAFNETPASVHMIVTQPVFSMHAVLACASHKLTMKPGTFLMFHDASASFSGKLSETEAFIKALRELDTRLLKICITRGILTDQEVKEIKQGRDVYLSKEVVDKRLNQ